MADEPDDGVTTICENCDQEVPVKDTHSCPDCGLDPLCPSCVCEDCAGEPGEPGEPDEDDSDLDD